MKNKLKPQEYKKIKDNIRIYLRGMSPHMIADISKLVFSHEAQTEEIKTLNVKLSEANQLKMTGIIDNPPEPYIPPVRAEKTFLSLIQRIADQIEHGFPNPSYWGAMLKYNNLTHEKALAMYEEWKKKNNDKT